MMRASRRNVRDEPRTKIEEEEEEQDFRMFLLPMELLHNGDDDDDEAHGQESRQHEATHKKK